MPNDPGMTEFEWRSCASKKRHDVEPAVKGFRAYLCRFCAGWHLATANKNGDIYYDERGYPVVPYVGKFQRREG